MKPEFPTPPKARSGQARRKSKIKSLKIAEHKIKNQFKNKTRTKVKKDLKKNKKNLKKKLKLKHFLANHHLARRLILTYMHDDFIDTNTPT